MVKKFLAAGLCVGVLGLSGLSAGTKFSFSVKGGLYAPSSTTINQEIVKPINTGIKDFVTQANAFGYASKSGELGDIGAEAVFGGEAEWYFKPRFSAALGVEFYRSSTSGNIEASGSEGTTAYAFTQKFDIKGGVIPILLTVRYHLPLGAFDVGLGAGAGWYLSQLDFQTSMDLNVNGQPVLSDTSETESSGQSILPHLNAGLSWELMNRISLAADLRYVFGRIGSFKIKKTAVPNDLTDELTYSDEEGNEKPVVWELGGLSAAICLKIRF